MRDRLKEILEKETADEKRGAKVAAVRSLAVLEQDQELAEMYGDSKDVGTENVGGSFPTLKVHYAVGVDGILERLM